MKILATTALYALCIWGVKISSGLFTHDLLAGLIFAYISGVFCFGGLMLSVEILKENN